MSRKLAVFAVVFMFISLLSSTGSFAGELPMREKADCMQGPLAQFGRYIGRWDISDSALSRETGEWEKGAGARWDFVCLGGMAVQDYWLPADGKVGTNLRTWNEETGSWDIAWSVTGMNGFAHIQASADEEGRVVMHYKSPIPDPLRRITFFPPDENGWKWKLEISSDSGENWMEVYRIVATPSSD